MLRLAANSLIRVFLAPECAACGALLARPLDGTVCGGCWARVSRITPPWCVLCSDAIAAWRRDHQICARCRRLPPHFAIARSGGRYDAALREIVHAFKYGGRRTLAAPLAALMRDAGGDVLHGADAVVPVPLHPRRALQRGFNQADDLARELGLPVWRVLRRRRHGPPQASLPAARRRSNVRAAFAPRQWMLAAPWRAAALVGRSLVLVDDVMTTGATLDACSRVLLEAGVRRVSALTAARAVALPPVPRAP